MQCRKRNRTKITRKDTDFFAKRINVFSSFSLALFTLPHYLTKFLSINRKHWTDWRTSNGRAQKTSTHHTLWSRLLGSGYIRYTRWIRHQVFPLFSLSIKEKSEHCSNPSQLIIPKALTYLIKMELWRDVYNK